LLLLLPVLAGGCTINLIRKPADPELLSRRIDFYKWLYDKGISRADPQLMRMAALKLLDVRDAEGGGGGEHDKGHGELLERALLRLERALDRLDKERPTKE
jgi:hypothetical protein